MGVGDGVGRNSKSSNRKSNVPQTPKITARKKSKNSLENKLSEQNTKLPRGLAYFEGLKEFAFPNYSDEVEKYLENTNSSENKTVVTPFTGHEYALEAALEALALDKYIVLVGETGIDKRSMAQYLAESLLDEKIKLPELTLPNSQFLLDVARSKIKDRFYSYMFLPNFSNNYDVSVLSYESNNWLPSKTSLIDGKTAKYYLKDLTDGIEKLSRKLARTIEKKYESFQNKLEASEKKDTPESEVKEGKDSEFILDLSTFLREEKLKHNIRDMLNSINSKKEDLIKKYSPTKKLIDWMNSVGSFLSSSEGMSLIFEGIEGTLKNVKNAAEDGKESDKTVYFKHVSESIPIDDLLKPHRINPNSANQNISYITRYDKSIFATFKTFDNSGSPHTDILNVGKFFSSPIIQIPHMREFITAITDNTDTEYVKPMILQGLKTGNYALDYDGKSYLLKSKRTIIGFDDSDPFFVLKGGMTETVETEFMHLIKQIDLFWYVDNTSSARKKTLSIMDSFIEKFNLEHKSNIRFEKDAYNALLQSLVMPSLEIANPELINAEYLDLESTVHKYAMYALSNKAESVNKQLMLKKNLEDVPPTYFEYLNSENRFGWILNDPEKLIGALNGITVWDNTSAALFKTKSQYYKHKNSNKKEHIIELVDSQHGMGDASASKGQALSADAFRIMLQRYGLGTEYNSFALKTYFKDEWDPDWAGPSASLAVGLSMMSEFTGTPLYQNRVVTGTLDPNQLLAQKIGWPYWKSLSAYRLSQIDPQKREWYFLFPASNIHDMTKHLALDHFEIEKHITLIPVRTFEEAYHLMSCGDVITKKDREFAHELGVKALRKQLVNQKKLDEIHKNKLYYTVEKQVYNKGTK